MNRTGLVKREKFRQIEKTLLIYVFDLAVKLVVIGNMFCVCCYIYDLIAPSKAIVE